MTSPYPTRGVVTAATIADLYNDPDVLPFFRGREWTSEKAAIFMTTTRRAANGREVRQSLQETVQWRWKLSHSFLRDLAAKPELQRLFGFYCSREGRYGFFFFNDPDELATANYQFGTGNGTQTIFVLKRPVGSGSNIVAEPVRAFWNQPVVTVNGVFTPVTVAPWGAVTFAAPPANNAILRWSGQHLHVCRFEDDELSLSQFAKSFWSQDGFEFVSDLP